MPEDPQEPPTETEGVGEDPGSFPSDQPATDPVGPEDPEPDVNDGEAAKPMGGDDDLISGQYGPSADSGEG